MAIDLGDIPTGTEPTTAEKLQIRKAIGVGQTDAPTFLKVTAYDATTSASSLNGFQLSSASFAGKHGLFSRYSSSCEGWALLTNNVANIAGWVNTPGPWVNQSIGFSQGNTTQFNPDTFLERDGVGAAGAGILAQRNGTAKQALRVYNTALSGAPEWAEFDWITSGVGNTLRIGTNKSGDGAARPIEFVTGGVVRINIASTTVTMKSHVELEAAYTLGWVAAKGTTLYGGLVNGNLRISNYNGDNFGLLQFGNTTSAFPALKRSTTVGQTTYLQARLADDSTFTNIQGKLTTDTAYTATTVVATGYITLYDSTGTAYRVPCAV